MCRCACLIGNRKVLPNQLHAGVKSARAADPQGCQGAPIGVLAGLGVPLNVDRLAPDELDQPSLGFETPFQPLLAIRVEDFGGVDVLEPDAFRAAGPWGGAREGHRVAVKDDDAGAVYGLIGGGNTRAYDGKSYRQGAKKAQEPPIVMEDSPALSPNAHSHYAQKVGLCRAYDRVNGLRG